MQVDCAEWFAGDMLGQIALAPDFFRFPYSPLEAQRQLDARLMETFRQLAYQRGAAIPDSLRQDKP